MSDIPFDPVQARRDEVAAYDANIAIYHAILAGLPSEWPANLEQYRHPKDQRKVIDDVPADKIELISQLWYADDIRHLIRTETLERTKAAAILAALEAQA
ncbi:MAG TPA: hypothetical protein VIG24_04180 [Acidimicrobiia bacterium]